MKFLIVVGIIAFVVLVLTLALLAVRSGGIRRRDYQRMKDELDLMKGELDLAVEVIEKIDQKADIHRDIYNDVDTPLASDVRDMIRSNRAARAAVSKERNNN